MPIRINCFYLIETEQEIIGVLALSDIKGRSINGAKKAAQKYLWSIKKKMNNTNRTKRNIIIFTIFSTLCGWIGYFVDKLTGQAHYENISTMAGEEPLGMLIWLVSPLICTMVLCIFDGDGWKNAGFAFNFKNNKILYLISFLVYPVVTIIVILLGVITKGIRFSNMSIGLTAYFGILFTQITIQFIKNIFAYRIYMAALAFALYYDISFRK